MCSVPAGIVAVTLLAVSIPAGFGAASPGTDAPDFKVNQALAWHNIRRLDFLGAGLLLSAVGGGLWRMEMEDGERKSGSRARGRSRWALIY
jgi:hypothetical protein